MNTGPEFAQFCVMTAQFASCKPYTQVSMPNRSSKNHHELENFAETAFSGREDAIGEAKKGDSEKNPAAVQLGRLGGLKGGIARAAKLSPEQRSDIARRAAQSRWKSE
jgi:hypothetical protein